MTLLFLDSPLIEDSILILTLRFFEVLSNFFKSDLLKQ